MFSALKRTSLLHLTQQKVFARFVRGLYLFFITFSFEPRRLLADSEHELAKIISSLVITSLAGERASQKGYVIEQTRWEHLIKSLDMSRSHTSTRGKLQPCL
jgi:hypothetical protein